MAAAAELLAKFSAAGALGAQGGAAAAGDANAPAAAELISPTLILVLCVVAGIGTVLMLPARRDVTFRKIGAAVLIATGLIFAAMLVHNVANAPDGGHMSVYFWVFSAVTVVGAIRVITHRRPVYSALYFVLSVIASAGLFILLWAEFMAAALVIIYAGAILVTYVFVIMLATQSTQGDPTDQAHVGGMAEYDRVSREPIAASAIGFTMMALLLFLIFDRAPRVGVDASATGNPAVAVTPEHPAQQPGSVEALGRYLFQNQLVNLELAGVLLTIAMVGAILIARRRVLIAQASSASVEVLHVPATPIDDNPHSIPVYGSENPRVKAYPET
jgi:NADH-quinone oxidoreductase subunit J